MSILIDSNVIIDVMQPEAAHHAASTRMLGQLFGAEELLINEMIWSELAPQTGSIEALDIALRELRILKQRIGWDAAFLAGLAHARYRKAGGTRERTLPDFLIGAHAQTGSHTLLTRDAGRYRSYFPELDILTPMDAT